MNKSSVCFFHFVAKTLLIGTKATEIKTLMSFIYTLFTIAQYQCHRPGKRQRHPYQNNTYMLLLLLRVCSLPGGERVRRCAV